MRTKTHLLSCLPNAKGQGEPVEVVLANVQVDLGENYLRDCDDPDTTRTKNMGQSKNLEDKNRKLLDPLGFDREPQWLDREAHLGRTFINGNICNCLSSKQYNTPKKEFVVGPCKNSKRT